jgi:tellurite resistance protein TerC
LQQTWTWIIFSIGAAAILIIDLLVLHRKPHAVRTREAAIWSSVWVSVALLFNLWILYSQGRVRALEFFTGYLIELSLSVDNIFVFVLIFAYFHVPAAYQHRVLFWGIVGAVILRGIFIFGGITLLHYFHWLIYILGGVLVYGGIHLFRSKKASVDPSKNRVLRLFRRYVPISHHYDEAHFLTHENGRRMATPLLAVLVVVESTDVVFAVDSIPAILAITRDSFIVFTSNICAILGLRSFYFLFASLIQRLRYLHYGLALILCFVGVKMILSDLIHIPIGASLGVVAGVLATSVVGSLLRPKKNDANEQVSAVQE